ncbi:MAG: hypothetical protein RIR73_564 [Chloroflexota bacterium]|jgi:alkylmercury lyase
MDEGLVWQGRHFIYSHIADTTRPPSVDEAAAHFGISTEEASELYKELHNRHALFLNTDEMAIRMANPFSGIPTNFKVHINGKTYFANCAWDMLGIPAALHCDAIIDAICTESNESVEIQIQDGNLRFTNDDLRIHFPLPFTQWYDDLVFT